ncbi:MAG: hypothetical protein AAGN66_04915 [Acidobacteriota bacterium]
MPSKGAAPTADGASPVQLLIERAAAAPEHPWLFFRRGLDWRWLSYRQVADQVARSAKALRDWAEDMRAQGLQTPRVAVDPRPLPDALVATLSAATAGLEAEAVDPASGVEVFTPPAARSNLDRWEAEPLEPVTAIEGTESRLWFRDDGAPLRSVLPAGSVAAAEALTDTLPPPAGARPILMSGADLGAARLQALAAWTLSADAAWVLEPQKDAFAATVLWVRPTHLVARGDDFEDLARDWDRRASKQSRLVAVVTVVSEDGPSATASETRFGVPEVPFPEPPGSSAEGA